MKKLSLSLSAFVAVGTFAVAGGDIAPVEPVVETPVVTVSDSGFYAGIAYTYLNEELTRTVDGAAGGSMDESFSDMMLQAGYKINSYVAVEARYWIGLDDVDTGTANFGTVDAPDAFGLYVKPMYPVTDKFDVYALLGYGYTDTNINKLDGFSWGLGGSYGVADNISLFVDYTNLYDDSVSYTNTAGNVVKKDYTIDTWNFGVSYKF